MTIVLTQIDVGNSSVYQRKAYGEAVALGSNAKWRAASSPDGRWHLPLLLRAIPHRGLDAASPYGYPGIHIDPSLSKSEVASLWLETAQLLAEHGIVSLFLRLPPYERDLANRLSGVPGINLQHLSNTVEVSTIDIDSTWTTMQGRARTAVRKARKAGYVARALDASPELRRQDSPFRKLYDATMMRVGASPQLQYSDDYYSVMLDGIEDRVRLVEVLDSNDQVVASAMILLDAERVHYHLSGSDPSAARLGANNLLIWEILSWSHRNGFQAVHLGGGTGPNDSLFVFKSSFGGTQLPFYVGKSIIQPEVYAELVQLRAAELGTDVESIENASYFPAYRAEKIA